LFLRRLLWRLRKQGCSRTLILTSLPTLMQLRLCPAHRRQILDALPLLTRHDGLNHHHSPPTLLRSAFARNPLPSLLAASRKAKNQRTSLFRLKRNLSSTLRARRITLFLRYSLFCLQRPHLASPPHLRYHPAQQQHSLRRLLLRPPLTSRARTVSRKRAPKAFKLSTPGTIIKVRLA
jgi:hypothetical protein